MIKPIGISGMNELPIKKLTALIKHFGHELLNDSARCDELLNDLCGEHRLEVNLLISALRESCARDLIHGAADGLVAEEVFTNLTTLLQCTAGIMPIHADWAVNGVAKALDLQIASPVVKKPIATLNTATTFHKLALHAPKRESYVTNSLSHIEPLRNCKAYDDAVALAASYAVTGTADENMVYTIGTFLEINDLDPLSHVCDVIIEGYMQVANKLLEDGTITLEDEHKICSFLEQTTDHFPIEEYAEYLSTTEKLIRHISVQTARCSEGPQ